ncbi:hypothetical protein FCM35_KLT15188 [Carex littledalei]|uniref:Uncharacterized protein n=1 Tax=Carex littledalei TaxID=544730 RepID=A0A833QL43_9POAL|nr:hypothetical protein FCM35_KLT15188 [Carex littledalei]
MEQKQEEKRSTSPCYKKKEGAGLLADMQEHLEQFKSTSAEKHWICLKNTARRAGDYVRQKKQNKSVYGSSKVGTETSTGGKETADATATMQSQ